MKSLSIFLFYFIALFSSTSFSQAEEQTPGCLDSLKGPNAFSPNGDGKNDVYTIDFPCVPDKVKISILNRWGQPIYESKYPGFQWDGKNEQGEEMDAGVYHYSIEFVYLKEKKTVQGTFMLMR